MMYFILNFVELIMIIIFAIIFNITIKENKNLERKVEELQIKLKYKQSYEKLSRDNLIKAMYKIKKYFIITKTEKIIIIQWLMTNFKEDVDLLNKINVRKKYTFKKACDNILNYCTSGNNMIEALNSAFYLINLSK